MAGKRVHVVMSEDLIERVDKACVGESRGAWIKRAVEEALAGGEPSGQAASSAPGRSSGSKPVGPGATPGVPAKSGPPSVAETWRR